MGSRTYRPALLKASDLMSSIPGLRHLASVWQLHDSRRIARHTRKPMALPAAQRGQSIHKRQSLLCVITLTCGGCVYFLRGPVQQPSPQMRFQIRNGARCYRCRCFQLLSRHCEAASIYYLQKNPHLLQSVHCLKPQNVCGASASKHDDTP